MKLEHLGLAVGILGVLYLIYNPKALQELRQKIPALTIPSLPTPTVGGVGNDKFGIQMIYPTATGGKTWYSTNWSTPFYFPPVGDPKFTKKGEILTVTGTSPRLTVKGNWKNTEVTLYRKGAVLWVGMHGGSDHHNEGGTKKNAWGGYNIKFHADGHSWLQAEPVHGTYCNPVPFPKPTYSYNPNIFQGFKSIQKTVGNNVLLESYADEAGNGKWRKVLSMVHGSTHSLPCMKKPITTGGPMVWVRFDEPPGPVQIKNMSVREIK